MTNPNKLGLTEKRATRWPWVEKLFSVLIFWLLLDQAKSDSLPGNWADWLCVTAEDNYSGNLVVPERRLHSLTSFIELTKNLSLFSLNYIFINKLVIARPEAEADAQVVVANSSFKPGKEVASSRPSAASRTFLAMTFLAWSHSLTVFL